VTQMLTPELPLKLPPREMKDGQAEDRAWQTLCQQAKELHPAELKVGDKFIITSPYRRMAKVLAVTSQQATAVIWVDVGTGGVDANNPLRFKRNISHERWIVAQVGRLRKIDEQGAKEVAEVHFVVVEDDRPIDEKNASVIVPNYDPGTLAAIASGQKLPGYKSVEGVPYTGPDEPENDPNAIRTQEAKRQGAGSDQGDGQAAQQGAAADAQGQGANAGAVCEQPRRGPGRPPRQA